jgi:hypothetical protein
MMRHGRACPGHPRLAFCSATRKTWMPATSAGMTAQMSPLDGGLRNGYRRPGAIRAVMQKPPNRVVRRPVVRIQPKEIAWIAYGAIHG